MEMITLGLSGDGGLSRLVELADEMAEDPACRVLLVGNDGARAIMITVWGEPVGAEVATSLQARFPAATIDRFRVHPGLATWR